MIVVASHADLSESFASSRDWSNSNNNDFNAMTLVLLQEEQGRMDTPLIALNFIECFIHRVCGPGSVAGIATGYGAGRCRDRIPVWARFSAPVQTGPRAHPDSCIMGTGSFPAVKSGWDVTLTPHPLLVPW